MTDVIVDLTMDDDEPVATDPQPEETDDEEEEEEAQWVHLGSLSVNIVGIRYYTGVAHPGEYVQLIREPHNPYDHNAIRVDNMSGEKVGHIKATTAQGLAPIMDTMSTTIQLDGTIPRRGSAYTLPLELDVYGTQPSDFDTVSAILKRHGLSWNNQNAAHQRTSNNNNKKTDSSTYGKDTVQVSSKQMDWQSAQKELDHLFDKLSAEQLQNLPNFQWPTTLTTKLLDHQTDGVRWLYRRETDTPPAPFYKRIKEKGKSVWFSEITNSTQPEPPTPCKGSILADDMGLGKSIQALALMLANPPMKDGVSQTTLIVCPVSVMPNWLEQIEQHVEPGTLTVASYHGSDRYSLLEPSTIKDIDVLITTYATISADYNKFLPGNASGNQPKKKKARRSGPSLFEHKFWRIILDEAHIIRNTKAKMFAGCSALKTTYRLCLTGTPLQNKPDDIHSLFSFLQLEPLQDRNVFRRAISQPIQRGDGVGLARLRTMMAHVALRRNKSKLDLVEKTVELRAVAFPDDCRHKKVHETLFESAKVAFHATLSAGDDQALKNYMMILESLLRIRQACVSGCLIPQDRVAIAEKVLAQVKGRSDLTAEEGVELLKKLKGAFDTTETVECAVCLEELEEIDAVILRSCSHVYCEACIARVSEQSNHKCPLCRQPFNQSDMVKKSAALEASDGAKTESISGLLDELGVPPKLEALEQAISNEMQPDEKGVIFSQFTKGLDVVQKYLVEKGHPFVRIDGSKTTKQRVAAMKSFSGEDGPRFILCSLHAAGTGITLTRASYCFMLDTWWNVSVENQAMDRVHRIGQTRPVKVIRFIMKDSIEERMIALQEAKAAIGKGAVQKLSAEEVRKTRLGDLKSLFSIQ